MSAMPKITDLDAKLDDGKPRKTVPTKPVKLFGRVWNVRCDINSFAVAELAEGNISAISAYMRNTVVAEEADDFVKALIAEPDLDGERLSAILNALIEVQAERPTKQPSDFQRPAKKRAPVRKSTARSSSTVRRTGSQT